MQGHSPCSLPAGVTVFQVADPSHNKSMLAAPGGPALVARLTLIPDPIALGGSDLPELW